MVLERSVGIVPYNTTATSCRSSVLVVLRSIIPLVDM